MGSHRGSDSSGRRPANEREDDQHGERVICTTPNVPYVWKVLVSDIQEL